MSKSMSKEMVRLIGSANKKGTSPYDTQAEVVRVEGNTAWVHIPGGVDETPVRMTMNASPMALGIVYTSLRQSYSAISLLRSN